ncbi:putative UBX domain-containing protein 1 [Operophtera brumata]|uniref:Putative UBX domain-containing protein 1 n=1 Tax=Operophtera brumata TaxID=104452 RepID=A0A0L7KYQ5_OPEBR|nr:putative UBX domain-containing protein 1 [Operophtera brumata]
MSLFDTAVFNSTLYEALYLQIGDTLSFARDFFESCVSSLPAASFPKSIVDLSELSFYEEIAEIFYFNEFQYLLLKTFFLILLFTLLLILISWRVYGKRISERFMKPVEAKFKLAGPGHKLSDAASSSRSSVESKNEGTVKRSGLTEESKVAAEAALARLSLKRENPLFNTSYAFIQAQVKKELETEQASSSRAEETPRETKATPTSSEGECPMLTDDILPREEWRAKIREFLEEMKGHDLAGAGALILQTCNSNREKIDLCVETLSKYIENLIEFPNEEKYHKIRMSNKVFGERVLCLEGSLDILHAAGYREHLLPYEDGQTNFLTVLEQVRDAQVIPLELDRNLQVLLPSQAAGMVQLPPAFYALSPDELKKEQLLRTEAIEKSQMLRTKAMREKEELREMRKYKYALIRVRFPDGILLQGTFFVYERYTEIHEFVRDSLELSEFPFVLVTPTGQKLTIDDDANKTLVDLRLVPTIVLNFAWHASVAQDIKDSPNKDMYLKPEIMVLVKEI